MKKKQITHICIFPLALYLIALITTVYLTGISPEPLLIVFPIGIFATACWFIVPFFIGMLTARLSEYKLWVRALYASIASLAINLVLPFLQEDTCFIKDLITMCPCVDF